MAPMESRPIDGILESADGAHDGQRRLWTLLRPTLSHDLPNMLVALNGLLQMLRQEEEERLGSAGREYLQRLTAVGQKLQATVGTLRLLYRTSALAPVERIDLAELLRELAAAGKQLFSGSQIVFHSSLKVPQVQAPRLQLAQVLVELLRALGTSSAGEQELFAASRQGRGEVELTLGHWSDGLRLSDGEAAAPAAALDHSVFGQDHRLGLILAEELARRWGGSVTALAAPGARTWLRVTIPDPPAADDGVNG